jgi:hypothetical protein
MLSTDVLSRLNIGYDAINLDTYQSLLYYEYEGKTFYLRVSDTINHIMKKVHEPLGNWRQNPHPKSNSIQMGVVFNGRWGRENTWNTNRSGQRNLFVYCNKFLEKLRRKGNKTFKLRNGKEISTDKIYIDDSWENDVNLAYKKLQTLLWIIDENSNEWFVRGNKVCDETNNICREQMIKGDTAERIFEIYDHHFFNNCIKEYSTGLGDPRDISEGADLWIHYEDKEEKCQIKFDRYRIVENNVVTTGNFSAKSKCDYFIIVSPENIILMKNKYNGYKIKHKWYFPINNIIKEIKIIDMFEHLKEIMALVEKQGLTLEITKEGEKNGVTYNPETKVININFIENSDEDINLLLKEQLEKLKERFN